ncbi:MAG: metallophosphoesterase [Acidimicrobiia bacterium]
MALFKRKPPSHTVTLFFASDLHGSEVCWRKFVAAAGFYGADVLILGGDFTGKLVIPIVQQSRGRFQASFMGKQHELTEADLPKFERRVADSGFYPVHVDPERLADLNSDPAKVDDLFKELMTERLVNWIQYAAEKLSGTSVKIYTAPANDDPYYIDEVIAEHGGNTLINAENKLIEIAPGHEMISTGYTNRTPWNTPREHDEPDIAAHVEQMAERLDRVETSIFNIHPPPFGTRLDMAPKLTERLEVVTSTGATVMENVGSSAVFDCLKRYQPMLSLHGHIHEAAGQERIGRTLAINPGSEYGEGVLKGALVTIGDGQIHSFQATSG